MQRNITDSFDQEVDFASSLDALQKRLLRLEGLVIEHERSASLLNAVLESTEDGVLVVNDCGQIVRCNRQFLSMWNVPAGLVDAKAVEQVFEYCARSLLHPNASIAQCKAPIAQTGGPGKDILELKDGRVFERQWYSHALTGDVVVQVWRFSDVTAHIDAEDFTRARNATGDSARAEPFGQEELTLALERKELVLHWQPQFDRKGDIVGVEALLGWDHPEQGMLKESDFIRAVEDPGLVKRLGDQVIGQACRLLLRLATENPDMGPLHVVINIIPQQFKQADFVENLRSWLELTGANPALLTIELGEELLIDNACEVESKLGELQKLGVRISIDHFGVGFSSVACLKRLPIDEVKIDESLVKGIVSDHDTVSIVEAIVVMATKLHLSVLADGVECEKAFGFLKGKNCRAFQGELLCPPLTEEALSEFLAERRKNHLVNNGMQSAFENF